MTEETFIELISKLEQELLRDGLTLEQIETCEVEALGITRGEFKAGPVEYICTVNRLANSVLY